jgi:hypothetical protein
MKTFAIYCKGPWDDMGDIVQIFNANSVTEVHRFASNHKNTWGPYRVREISTSIEGLVYDSAQEWDKEE